MKFNCIHCGKKYGISDEKLKRYGSIFKMRCQVCKNVLSIDNPYSEKKESSEKWYLYLNGKQIGPVTLTKLKAYKDRGLKFSTLIWKVGMKDWKQAQFIPELEGIISLPVKHKMRKVKQTESLNKLFKESKAKIEQKNIKAQEAEKRAAAAKKRAEDAKKKADLIKIKEERLKLINAQEEAAKLKRLSEIKVEESSKLLKAEQDKIQAEKKAIEQEVQKAKAEAKKLKAELEKEKSLILQEAEKAKAEAEAAREIALKEAEEAKAEAEKAKKDAERAKHAALREAEEATATALKEAEDARKELAKIKKEAAIAMGEAEMISADEFFDSDFEEKKISKNEKLLRSTGKIDGEGILLMEGEKRKKERWMFFLLIGILLVAGAIAISYFANKKAEVRIVEKEKIITKIKTVKVKGDTEYVLVNGEKVKKKKKYSKNTIKKDSINNIQKDSIKKDPVKNKTYDAGGGRKLTSTGGGKVAIKETKKTISTNGNYTSSVQKVISDSKSSLNWCYRKELKNEPDAKMKVTFNVNISESGRVNSVSGSFKPSKYNDSQMASCMKKKIKNWRFPVNPDGGSTNFKIPSSFSSN